MTAVERALEATAPAVPESLQELATARVYALGAGRCEERRDWPRERRDLARSIPIWHADGAMTLAITHDAELAGVMVATKWAEGL
jgi:hypothetical protein